jgi:hypothetical protein
VKVKNTTQWEDLALVFRDEVQIETLVSELFQRNFSQLKNIETLSTL